ncbi:MAG: putative hemolysin [Halioglobus sp.]
MRLQNGKEWSPKSHRLGSLRLKHLTCQNPVDAPWATFDAKLIRDAQSNVVPIYFHGQNSRIFHLASHIAEPLRMALLLNEARNKFGQPIHAEIGDTFVWDDLGGIGNRQELTAYLYNKVQSLA